MLEDPRFILVSEAASIGVDDCGCSDVPAMQDEEGAAVVVQAFCRALEKMEEVSTFSEAMRFDLRFVRICEI